MILPHLNRTGTKRAQIEAVHVHPDFQGRGIGKDLTDYAITKAKEVGCGIVQLTTHKDRNDAHRFYERLGFEPSHIGMKLYLEENPKKIS